jgi:hypothetical protein
MSRRTGTRPLLLLAAWCAAASQAPAAELPAAPRAFVAKHCAGCHGAETKKAGLDLQALSPDLAKPEVFARWLKVHDRLESGEMPPATRKRPPAAELRPMLAWLKASLTAAEGAHERMGSFETGSTVGLFRHEDESVSHYFMGHVTVHPGRYRVRTSLWAFGWDKGKVLPARLGAAGRLSVVQLTGDGRGGQHPSYTLGYYAAPSLKPAEHELTVWLNRNELVGFNPASLAPVANYNRPGRALAFTGPGVAVDWLDVEGPLHDVWPPRSHRLLFGDLPLREFKAKDHPGVRPPPRPPFRRLGVGKNRPDPVAGVWTVHSDKPLEDADRLLAAFLPRAFRRPVEAEVRKAYVAKVAERLKAGDCFEAALRWAYRAALCSPDFLFHAEPADRLDGHALACRLCYFLWNSPPDEALSRLAAAGKLTDARVLREQTERLLRDAKSRRFVEDFLGQWLKLRQIAANDADRKLYPEFSPYLQDSMVAETHAYFRELLEKDLDAGHLVRSDFVMVNEKLATHYGIPGVSGPEIRRVALPRDCPRGGFLTQASVLKIAANGTTTSPVTRGAFVLDRLLGQPPEPPPADVPAVEPDVRGATTTRELLAKHRTDRDVRALQALLAADRGRLLRNLAGQLAVYAAGRGLAFRDRDALAAVVARTEKQGGGVRTLVHELVQSKLFQTR